MNDDLRAPLGQPMYAPSARDAQLVAPVAAAALPAGAFTAGVLLDVLSLVAENSDQARTYQRRAAELLRVGLGASLATLALGLVDALQVPATTPAGRAATTGLVLDGGILAIYLLDLAARQKQIAETRAGAPVDLGAVALSMLGLALLGARGKLK